MAEPIESGSRITSGSIVVPSWATVMDYAAVSDGGDGRDGSTWSSGAPGSNGDLVYGSVKIRPGSTISCSIGSTTTINFTTVVASTSGGPRKSGSTVTVPAIEGDPSVGSSWAADLGSRGNGGAGGSSGGGDPDRAGKGSPGTGGGVFWRFRKAAQDVRLGNIRAHDVKIGNKQVQAIYIGTKKVWEKSIN